MLKLYSKSKVTPHDQLNIKQVIDDLATWSNITIQRKVLNPKHGGEFGHMIEFQLGIKPNSDSRPDIRCRDAERELKTFTKGRPVYLCNPKFDTNDVDKFGTIIINDITKNKILTSFQKIKDCLYLPHWPGKIDNETITGTLIDATHFNFVKAGKFVETGEIQYDIKEKRLYAIWPILEQCYDTLTPFKSDSDVKKILVENNEAFVIDETDNIFSLNKKVSSDIHKTVVKLQQDYKNNFGSFQWDTVETTSKDYFARWVGYGVERVNENYLLEQPYWQRSDKVWPFTNKPEWLSKLLLDTIPFDPVWFKDAETTDKQLFLRDGQNSSRTLYEFISGKIGINIEVLEEICIGSIDSPRKCILLELIGVLKSTNKFVTYDDVKLLQYKGKQLFNLLDRKIKCRIEISTHFSASMRNYYDNNRKYTWSRWYSISSFAKTRFPETITGFFGHPMMNSLKIKFKDLYDCYDTGNTVRYIACSPELIIRNESDNDFWKILAYRLLAYAYLNPGHDEGFRKIIQLADPNGKELEIVGNCNIFKLISESPTKESMLNTGLIIMDELMNTGWGRNVRQRVGNSIKRHTRKRKLNFEKNSFEYNKILPAYNDHLKRSPFYSSDNLYYIINKGILQRVKNISDEQIIRSITQQFFNALVDEYETLLTNGTYDRQFELPDTSSVLSMSSFINHLITIAKKAIVIKRKKNKNATLAQFLE